jgi:hypothetical protein
MPQPRVIPLRQEHLCRFATVALAAISGLLLFQVATENVLYLLVLSGVAASAAIVAAAQVRHDDVLGWLSAVGAATLVVALVVTAHTTGLPGHRPASWGMDGPLAVGLGVAVAIAAVARAARWCRHRAS